jgi:prepilin-type N-terminal cleavage/methylation domain-containing protein
MLKSFKPKNKKYSFFSKKLCQGLTLVEMLTVVSILVILSGIMFANYKSGNDALILDRASQKLAQDLRRTMGMSISGQGLSVNYNAYGIYFSTASNSSYILFKNNANKGAGNFTYSTSAPADSIFEIINIEKGAKICELKNNGTVIGSGIISVAAVPPAPTIYMDSAVNNDDIYIVIAPENETNCSNPVRKKVIKINNAGRIDITN